ncbi:C4-dicarboxylate transporter DctA [Candidatus Methylospira mobilis]|uniref:C4-dicarboxylate transporter DctA n=1 Tax=Candidatus Methylospira mobilis TaxID=1808979 RepID=A0A5Q0BMF1_9GAMM|nr:C4-dicarboxylate transporter DctA [Candidatus Methylospira mobilis]QFY43404.1 C4-dicarboxylate transporter DctA [Candidatus Methylospira mobilis]WNV03359.1 C4-dicarboxylate transporter DctA [Candidatus Methylospira mobilis]
MHILPLCRQLYVQVLIAIALGILLGIFCPETASGAAVKALGEGFIKLIKMMIPPIIFCTVVSGIAHIQDAKKVGRIGVKALLYFEVISTFALIIGLLVGNILQPGRGFSSPSNVSSVAGYAEKASQLKPVDFVLGIIPDSFFGALAAGDILHVLVVAVLFGFSLMALRERGQAMRVFIEDIAHVMFGILSIIMKAAPIGAFGAMAFTIGKYGPQSLASLAGLVAGFYLTATLFVVVVLGTVARIAGFNILHFLLFIKDELLLVLGTSSSESALPRLMSKLQALGCSKPVVGLVIPTGYSFNLDGTNIYMTLTTLFIAQALNIDLTWGQQATILVVAMLTSKGASGVSGAGFITLAATLAAIDPAMVPGMAIVFGIDKFMSECRALTNMVGNSVATVVIASWEGELDRDAMRNTLGRTRPNAGNLTAEIKSSNQPGL